MFAEKSSTFFAFSPGFIARFSTGKAIGLWAASYFGLAGKARRESNNENDRSAKQS
jgi:hypothetical protein